MRIDDLVGAIYDAAVDPTLWQPALVRVSDALSAIGTLYLSYDLQRPERSVAVLGRLDPDLTRSYLIRHSRSSPWAKMRQVMPVGQVVSVDAYVPAAQLIRTEFYHDILRPQRILHCGAACLARDAQRFVGFSIFRAAEAGPTEDQELRLLSVLAPHIKRATQINQRLGTVAAFEQAKTSALDLSEHGIILLDTHARVLFANRAAESILALHDGLTITASTLRAATPADTRRLHVMIAETVRGSSGGTLRAARPSFAEPFLLLVAPARAGTQWPVDAAPAVVIFVTDPDRPPRPETRRLGELFGLTATEAKVAVTLAGGSGVPQTAAALKLSSNTVHTHMRRIFRKFGVNRQAELVRVLMRAAMVAPERRDD